MKKILSNIHILLTALCLCFAACERNEEVIVCTVTIADEKVISEDTEDVLKKAIMEFKAEFLK